MILPLLKSRPARALLRRATAAALFALQLSLAMSPLGEGSSTASQASHAHDQRTHHPVSHDEATCAVCAARTQLAIAADLPEAITEEVALRQVAVATLVAAPARADWDANGSRAPPTRN